MNRHATAHPLAQRGQAEHPQVPLLAVTAPVLLPAEMPGDALHPDAEALPLGLDLGEFRLDQLERLAELRAEPVPLFRCVAVL